MSPFAGNLASDDNLIEDIADAPAFRRKWKEVGKKHRPARYLPDEAEYKIMLMCSRASDNKSHARENYENVPLSDVYRWLAISTAEVPPDD